ncbi:condensation domain-containing protein [Streptomyces antimicrobicus]|uniref:Condensation domain-containing protein n=1 Tax=Streptomyces antimicrobicus TaxID=2883108 RepID=A0ABS8AZX4_9ACTN|nr:condensation domain-containing protein [Streptomyces antimicrobicus]MCB5177905.1 condensation domain-containing protein [Streptomyces antimicrobicus]
MLQLPVEDMEMAPGHALEWTVSAAGAAGHAEEGAPEVLASYNQQDHFAVAQALRAADIGYSSYIGGSFEIRGRVEVEALEAALLHLVRRHEVLRCEFRETGEGAEPGATGRAADGGCGMAVEVVPPQDVKLERVDAGRYDTPAEAAAYVRDFLRRTDTLRGPWIVMGAMVRDDCATVYFACDHLLSDGVSTPVAVHDIAMAYEAYAHGREPDLPQAGSFLDHAAAERGRGAALAADDPLLDQWKGFAARGGGALFPRFPLDLGIEPGVAHRAVNEADTLLTADRVDALEAHCRAVGGRTSTGVLAALGVGLRKAGGPDVHRALVPVSTRGRDAREHSMGWFVNTLPVEFPVADGTGFAGVMAGAQAALDGMRPYTGVPFVRVHDLLTGAGTGPQVWPFAVSFFSYLDFRRTPGAHSHVAWKARKYVSTSHSNGIFFWFHRNHTGLHLNSIFVDTPEARRAKATCVGALVQSLDNIARSGRF